MRTMDCINRRAVSSTGRQAGQATLLICLLFATPLASPAGELRLLDGTTRQGEPVSLGNGELSLKGTDGKVIPIPLDAVLRWDLAPVPPRPPLEKFTDLELTDGTMLRCASLRVLEKSVEVMLAGGMKVTLPVDRVANLLMNGADDATRKDWETRLAQPRRRDMLGIMRQGALNSLEGTLGSGDGEGKTIGFTPQGIDREARVPLTSLHGLAFERAPDPNLDPLQCRLLDTGGNRLAAAAVTLANGVWTVRLSGKLELVYPAAGSGGLVPARLDFSRGKLAYLSDMEPVLVVDPVKEDPSRFRAGPSRDRNLDMKPLRISGVTYNKGLGLSATTVLEYELGGEFREFRCLAGFDDTVSGAGGTMLLVEGDGRELFRRQLTRDGSRSATAVAVAVKDVKKLRVSVLPTGDGLSLGYGCHLHLGDARVSK